MVFQELAQRLSELMALATALNNDEYARPIDSLDGASVGAHIRHVVEMLQCLQKGYDSGTIDYDDRNRSTLLETDVREAVRVMASFASMDQPDKPLQLKYRSDGMQVLIETNYCRELLYNLEHAVHHQALIKVALQNMPHVSVGSGFGVAKSTLEYRDSCAR